MSPMFYPLSNPNLNVNQQIIKELNKKKLMKWNKKMTGYVYLS